MILAINSDKYILWATCNISNVNARNTYSKVNLTNEQNYVIPRVGNLREEKSLREHV
jgi:hypothetical protein